MKTPRLVLLIAAFAGSIFTMAGCATHATVYRDSRPTFALAVTVGGQPPTPAQWAVVRAKFAAMMDSRGWRLVDDPALAQQIIRVNFVPDPTDPEHKGETFVLGYAPNPDAGGQTEYVATTYATRSTYDDNYGTLWWSAYYWDQNPFWYVDYTYTTYPPFYHGPRGGISGDHRPGNGHIGEHKPGDHKPGDKDHDKRSPHASPPPPDLVKDFPRRVPINDDGARHAPRQPHNPPSPGSSDFADRPRAGSEHRGPAASTPRSPVASSYTPPSAAYSAPRGDSRSPSPTHSYTPPSSHSYTPPPSQSHTPAPSHSYSPPPAPSYSPPPAPSYSPPPSSSSSSSNSSSSSSSDSHYSGSRRPNEN